MQPLKNEKYVMSVKEAAEVFNLSPRTIRHYLKTGKWPGIKAGREWKVLNTDNQIFLKYLNGRNISADLALLKLSEKEIRILGINALGPLHQGREILIKKLRNGVNIKILLLDVNSPIFTQRELKEECINNKLSGRLNAEYFASIAICRDIQNFASDSPNLGLFKLHSHKTEPTRAMIIIDPDDSGCCSLNLYPELDNIRGLMGKQSFFSISGKHSQEFKEAVSFFDNLWVSSEPINL